MITIIHIKIDEDHKWKEPMYIEVFLCLNQVISCEQIWQNKREDGEWTACPTDLWKVVCRDNIHYRVDKETAKLIRKRKHQLMIAKLERQ